MRTVLGLSKAHIMLNVKAFRAVHQELDASLQAMTAKGRTNPVDSALERLMEEARTKVA